MATMVKFTWKYSEYVQYRPFLVLETLNYAKYFNQTQSLTQQGNIGYRNSLQTSQ